MDVNDLRIAVTLIAFTAFVWVLVWSYLPSRRQRLEDEGRRILEDGEP
jgi:hypothetical protein